MSMTVLQTELFELPIITITPVLNKTHTVIEIDMKQKSILTGV